MPRKVRYGGNLTIKGYRYHCGGCELAMNELGLRTSRRPVANSGWISRSTRCSSCTTIINTRRSQASVAHSVGHCGDRAEIPSKENQGDPG